MAKMQVAEERGHGPRAVARKAAKAKNKLARVCPSVLLLCPSRDLACGWS